MTHTDGLKIVLLLTTAYPNWKPTDESIALYAQLLEPFEVEAAKATVMQMLYSPREFAPPIGVLAEAIAVSRLKQVGQYLSPEEAWAEVRDRIHYVGFYRKPSFSSPALTRAVQAMDWGDLCTNENVEASRAHLMRIFAAMQGSQVKEGVRALITGELATISASEASTHRDAIEQAGLVENLVSTTAASMGTKKKS